MVKNVAKLNSRKVKRIKTLVTNEVLTAKGRPAIKTGKKGNHVPVLIAELP